VTTEPESSPPERVPATDLVIGMAGSGGDGIVSAGESLISAAASEGYHAMMTKSFGSQIRGGESSCRVRIGTTALHNPGGVLDVAVALNWEDFLRFGGELPVGDHTVVIYEEATKVAPDELPLGDVTPTDVFPVPIKDIAKKSAGTQLAKNTVVLGLLAGWFDLAPDAILSGVRKRFAKKSAELVEMNEKAFQAGIDYAKEHPLRQARPLARVERSTTGLMLLDGNDMCAAASIFAGCDFFGGYPITPSTEVMQYLTREIWRYGGSVLQAEDEIAGVGAAVGASFAGKKAMTATSGPGMALKTEMLGLATIAELPLVLVNVQRGGPSTGLPTKPEQSDLFQAAFSGHGDVLRPVLAATSVADTFRVTVEAFNLAEHYQTPVIVLSDQEIAQRKETVDAIDTDAFEILHRRVPTEGELEDYHRYASTESGISPISHPGLEGGNYLAGGIEHDEKGSPSVKGEVHVRMNEKRFRKLDPLLERDDLFSVEGDADAALGMIAWGSVAGVCREALALVRASGVRAKLLVPTLLWPVAERIYGEFLSSLERGLIVELSHQGQLHRMLRMHVDLPPGLEPLTRSGANPFRPAEVARQLTQLQNGGVR